MVCGTIYGDIVLDDVSVYSAAYHAATNILSSGHGRTNGTILHCQNDRLCVPDRTYRKEA